MSFGQILGRKENCDGSLHEKRVDKLRFIELLCFIFFVRRSRSSGKRDEEGCAEK